MPDLINDNEPEVPEVPETPEKPARSDNRFKDLSDKVELTAKERDEANLKAQAAEKEVEFYKGFNKVADKFEGANEYQDKIKEKFLSGTDLEEAAVTTLYKAGKLNNMPAAARRDSPVGGSAATAMRGSGEKTVSEMTQAEKRQALIDSDREQPGSLTSTLRNINYGG